MKVLLEKFHPSLQLVKLADHTFHCQLETIRVIDMHLNTLDSRPCRGCWTSLRSNKTDKSYRLGWFWLSEEIVFFLSASSADLGNKIWIFLPPLLKISLEIVCLPIAIYPPSPLSLSHLFPPLLPLFLLPLSLYFLFISLLPLTLLLISLSP